jgi:RNase H-like domain found in reverse transcriptase
MCGNAKATPLGPLTTLMAKEVPWKWGKEQQEAFEEIKKVISKDTMLAFPRFDKPFHVYTDMQEGRPLAFYSRKLNRAQKRYTTGEQELLSRVETLKEFRNILLGQKVIVHTDHKNIRCGNQTKDHEMEATAQRVWPIIPSRESEHNVVADALSHIHTKEDENVSGQEMAYCMSRLARSEAINAPEPTLPQDMATCFKGSEDVEFEQFPMKTALIAHEQVMCT